MAERCDNPAHKGHRRFIGGCMDGTVTHQIYADPSDYPQTFGTLALGTALGRGTRSWYEIDYEASDGTEVVYRHIGDGYEFPQAPVTGGG